jgi:hypothetical protein
MANAITTMTHTLLAGRIFEAFVAKITPMTRFSNNFSEAETQRGNKVKVPFVSSQDAAGDFGGTYTMQDADVTGKDITIDKRKFVSWALTSQEIADNPQLSMDMFTEQKAFQLAKAFQQDVWSLITNANYGAAAITSTAANFDTDDVVDLATVCDTADWPEFMRSLILKETYCGALLKDTGISDAGAYGSDSAVKDGIIARLSGFDVMKSTLIPANGENLVGFAANPDAILLASRVIRPDDVSNTINFETFTDEATGITASYREWFDADTDTTKRVLEFNYGYLLGNPAAIKRIVSA